MFRTADFWKICEKRFEKLLASGRSFSAPARGSKGLATNKQIACLDPVEQPIQPKNREFILRTDSIRKIYEK